MKFLLPLFLLVFLQPIIGQNTLEDFENGATLPWAPFNQQAVLHGSFVVADNPVPDGVNGSAKVGQYTKGFSTFSTLTANAPVNLGIYPQFNLDVWQMGGALNVTLQLKSPSQGTQEFTRYLLNPMGWETLSFDFSDFNDVTDWSGISLIFNLGTAEEGAVFYFDNLTQSLSTSDPCDGVVPVPNIMDDFECQRNYGYGAGANLLTQVSNPLIAGENQSTVVGQYADPPNDAYAALCVEIPNGIDLSSFNQMAISVLAPADMPAPIPVLMKLEGGSSPAAELSTAITTPGQWQKVSVDFSGEAGQQHNRACFFLNAGVGQATEDIYHIDNLRFEQGPVDRCVLNFEVPALSATDWGYFPNATDGPFSLVNNPVPGGINTSGKVGKAIENANSGQPWQGMFTELPSPIKFTSDKLVKMKVYAPVVTTVTMKLEGPTNPSAPGDSGDNTVSLTAANQWEELTFDFSNSPNPIPEGVEYQRLTLIFDVGHIPSTNRTYYFDDIRLNEGDCSSTTGVVETNPVAELQLYPNPVSHVLQVGQLSQIVQLEVVDLFGRKRMSYWVGNDATASLDVSALPTGYYFLVGSNAEGQQTGVGRFLKG